MTILRMKYPITQWILSPSNVKIGDTVAFEEYEKEIHGIVVAFPGDHSKLTIKRCDTGERQVINFYNTITYLIISKKNGPCTCGAKHTSNPDHHLSYCDAGD